MDERRYVFSGVALGLLGAVGMIFIARSQYEALVIVQVGQVSSSPAEPSSQAVERMKSPAFQLAVATASGDERWESLLRNSAAPGVLTLASPKGALNLIDLKAKSESPEGAKKIANAAIEELAKRHAEIAKPAVDRLTMEANLAREKLKRAESELAGLNKLLTGAGVKDEHFTQLSLMTNLRVQKEAEVFYQRQMLSALDGALTPPTTQPAKAIEDVFITNRPVSPKKGLLLALGLVGGLLVGVMWVFVSSAWQRARAQRELNGS